MFATVYYDWMATGGGDTQPDPPLVLTEEDIPGASPGEGAQYQQSFSAKSIGILEAYLRTVSVSLLKPDEDFS